MASASLKLSWFSLWQKYWLVKNSWVQMMCAPCLAAWEILAEARAKFSFGSGEQRVWINPSRTVAGLDLVERRVFNQPVRGLVTVERSRMVVPPLSTGLGTAWSNSSRMNLPSVSLVGP